MIYRDIYPTVLYAIKHVIDSIPKDVYKTELGARLEELNNQLSMYPYTLELPDEDLVGMYHMRFTSILNATIISSQSEVVKNLLLYANDLLNYLDDTILKTGKLHIVLATSNVGKLDDFKNFFKGSPFVIFCKNDLPRKLRDTVEDQDTFQKNATKKVRELASYLPKSLYALADDSGICVRALGGRPGVFSHRYASENPTEDENNALLLNQLGNSTDRYAYYVSVLALERGLLHCNDLTLKTNSSFPDNEVLCLEGVTEGNISYESRGINGFAYDKIFIPSSIRGNKLTMAELSERKRSKVLARNIALGKLKNSLSLLKLIK